MIERIRLSFKKYSNTDNTVVFLKSIAYRAYTRYAIKVYKSTVLSVLLYEGMNYNKWHLRLVPTASPAVKYGTFGSKAVFETVADVIKQG